MSIDLTKHADARTALDAAIKGLLDFANEHVATSLDERDQAITALTETADSMAEWAKQLNDWVASRRSVADAPQTDQTTANG